MVLVIVGLFIGAGIIPTINGYNFETIQRNSVYVSSVLDDDGNGDSPDDDGNFTFDDYTDDVLCLFFDGFFSSGMYRTDEKPNVNIISGSYSNDDGNVTLTLEVEGIIEDRGKFEGADYNVSNDSIVYGLDLSTSKDNYGIGYCNKTCILKTGDYWNHTNALITDFEVSGSTLTVTFPLNEVIESINSIVITAMDVYFDEDTFELEAYIDAATNIEYLMDIEITKPDNKLYLFNRETLPLSSPFIIGKIDVEIEELFNETYIQYQELYIDGKLVGTLDLFDGLTWNKFSFGKHTLKVLAFDTYGNRASDEIEVWKFF